MSAIRWAVAAHEARCAGIWQCDGEWCDVTPLLILSGKNPNFYFLHLKLSSGCLSVRLLQENPNLFLTWFIEKRSSPLSLRKQTAYMMKHDFSLLLSSLKIALNLKTLSKYLLLSLLLTGCSKNTAQYFSNAPEPSMKMKHQTTILNAETRQLTDSMVESLSGVNFEYELITTQ